MENERKSTFSVVEGASGSLYVVIGHTPEGYDAIDLESFAKQEEGRVTLPINSPIVDADLKRVLPRFENAYQQIIDKYSRPKVS
jgi:hypothetical protein